MGYTANFDIEIERYVSENGLHCAWVHIVDDGDYLSAMHFVNEYRFETDINVNSVTCSFYRVLTRMGHAVRILDVSRDTGGMVVHPYNEDADRVDWVDLKEFA